MRPLLLIVPCRLFTDHYDTTRCNHLMSALVAGGLVFPKHVIALNVKKKLNIGI